MMHKLQNVISSNDTSTTEFYIMKWSFTARIKSAFFCEVDLILLAWQKDFNTATVSLFKVPLWATSFTSTSTISALGFFAGAVLVGALRFGFPAAIAS